MGISALPQATVRTLGASQVLTDPSALVKELVDNALDANATSIAIEISSNTVDIVQVRDNGHGIAPVDRPLVARRYCTSKISHDEDLKDIGGSSLGFRGEALASAAELSGSLTISTRIEGEQVAAALKIDKKGEVAGQDKASLPVGTTIRITDFTKANPVRRQVVLKNAENCLKKIKRTLQAYAFARPHVRLSLRVLKAKDNKGGWVYAPKSNGNAEDVAFKVVGAACASQCTFSVLEDSGLTFQAFLPRRDADTNKISSHGAFISVDHRPVSSARGIFKQICKIFRENLKKSSPALADVKDPFLFLELSCPPGSYDANLEPAKDDLLFEDSTMVVEAAIKLLTNVYAANPPPLTRAERRAAEMPPNSAFETGFTTSLEPRTIPIAQERPESALGQAILEELPVEQDDSRRDVDGPYSAPSRKTRSNMYGCDEDDIDMLDVRPPTGRTEADFEELRQARKDVTVSNPWVMAKLNASVGRPLAYPVTRSCTSAQQEDSFDDPPSPPTKRGQRDVSYHGLPTPRPSSPTPPADSFHTSDHAPDARTPRSGRVIQHQSLPLPQPYTPVQDTPYELPCAFSGFEPRQPPAQYSYDPTSQVEPIGGTPLEAIPEISARPRRSPRKQPQQDGISRPFVSPLKGQPPREKVWFDHLENIERPRGPRRNRRQKQQDNSDLIIQGELGDLAQEPRPLISPRRNRDIRDFLGRNQQDSIDSIIARRQNATLQKDERPQEDLDLSQSVAVPEQRGFIPASEIAALEGRFGSFDKPEKRLTKRRKTSERQPLGELSTNAPAAEPEPETIDLARDDDEDRTAKSRRKMSRRKSSNKLGRTKSSRLPLESIPPGQGTQNLKLSMSVDLGMFPRLAKTIDEELSLVGYNEPAIPAPKDLDAASSHMLALTANLHKLLLKSGGDTFTDVKDPRELFKEVKAAFAARKEDEEDFMTFA